MKNVLKRTASIVAVAAIATSLALPASAGGLFGNGGLIRGDVGNFLDKNLEQPILTPAARTVTVVAGAAVGAYVAGEPGAIIGAVVGHGINEAVGPGRPAAEQRVATVEIGATCATQTVGNWTLSDPLPVGMECFVKLQNGAEFTGSVIK